LRYNLGVFSGLGFVPLVLIFLVAAVAVWFAGIRLSRSTDVLDTRLGLGEALGGAVLLAVATNLPEIAITASAALSHNLGIAIGNILGGIAIQTVVLVALDLAMGPESALTTRAASLVLALEGLLVIDRTSTLAGTRPVSARVIGQSPTLWYSTVFIDQGSGRGVRVGQPVITGDGLIGQVTTVTGNSAVVTLITDSDLAVAGRISENGAAGVVQTAEGGPSDLRLKYTSRRDRVVKGQSVVTAGTTSSSDRLDSPYPPGIPIGEITRVDDAGTDAQEGHLKPYADLQRLEFVQVLTRRVDGNRP